MRKITKVVCQAMAEGKRKSLGNTKTDGNRLYLFGNMIAISNEKVLTIFVENDDWFTVTTKERLNGLLKAFHLPYRISQSKGIWYINGEIWSGQPCKFDRVNNTMEYQYDESR